MGWSESQNLAPNWRERDKVEMVANRDGFGKGLLRAAEQSRDLVVLCGDLKESTRVEAFAEKFPERFFEVGVAEQNMVGIAAGLALGGKIPVAVSYAVFNPGRVWEQIRTLICYPNLKVIIVGSHAGLNVGPDGATHQALEDIALMRVLPNMKVLAPADANEANKAIFDAITKIEGPVYIRLAREKSPVFTNPNSPFEIGKAQVLREGKDVSVFACTPLVYEAMQAALKLEAEGVDVELINVPTIKPLDQEILLGSAKKTGAVVTVEEHQKIGGLGSAVAEILAENYPIPMERIGVQDHFGESGTSEELLEKYGLKDHYIIEAVKRIVSRKTVS